MAHQVAWLPGAIDDLEAIARYIATDSRVHAASVVEHMLTTAGALGQFPRLGRRVPEWNDDDIRQRIVFSYRLIFRIRESAQAVDVLAVIHGARPIPDEVCDRD